MGNELESPAKNMPHIIILSGSLREGSSTYAVINTATEYMSGKAHFAIYDGIKDLPHFDDSEDPAGSIVAFRNILREADAIFICTPEYAFGVPGSLKNALDWTVKSGEFANKPVALITAATGGDKAHASLQLTLTALSAHVADDAKLLISFIRAKMDEQGSIKDKDTIKAIHSVVDGLLKAIEAVKN